MKYRVNVNGQTFETAIEEHGEIIVDDRPFSVDMKEIDGRALFSLLIDHESYELVMDQQEGDFRVLLRGEMYQVTVRDGVSRQDGGRRAQSPASPPEIREDRVVRAPLPGLVVQVLVSEGQTVADGEVLVVLESMKMENELLAPRRARVKAIHVTPGDTPNLDDPLITLE
jgi:biotin carboxyl carrier protein